MNPNRNNRWCATVALSVLLSLAVSPAFADSARHECLIEPMVITDIGSPVQGVLSRLAVGRSEFVKAGDVLAELKSDVEQATFEQARARAAMVGEIRAREADLQLARHNMKRIRELYQQKMVPSQQLDEAEAQLSVAEMALKQARDNQRLMQHERERAKQMLAQRVIRSPVDGVVVEHKAFPGEFVYENPIMTVAQLDPLRVEVILPARMFGKIEPGANAMIYPEVNGGEPLKASVSVVDRLIDPRSGTFGVRLDLANADLAIPGGQKCQLTFSAAKEGADRVAQSRGSKPAAADRG